MGEIIQVRIHNVQHSSTYGNQFIFLVFKRKTMRSNSHEYDELHENR